jgi:hypothetical protein
MRPVRNRPLISLFIGAFKDAGEAALAREHQLKCYRREKKIQLIQEMNPKWDDLYEGDLRAKRLIRGDPSLRSGHDFGAKAPKSS